MYNTCINNVLTHSAVKTRVVKLWFMYQSLYTSYILNCYAVLLLLIVSGLLVLNTTCRNSESSFYTPTYPLLHIYNQYLLILSTKFFYNLQLLIFRYTVVVRIHVCTTPLDLSNNS